MSDHIETNSYQEMVAVPPWKMDLSLVLWNIIGKSLIFFVVYTILGRIVLEITNALGRVLAYILDYERDYYTAAGADRYGAAVVWPLLLLFTIYLVFAIIFVTVFKTFW